MKIIITGSNGFIGRNMTEHLQEQGGHTLLTPTRQELDLLDADALKQYIRTANADLILHFASHGNSWRGHDLSKILEYNLRIWNTFYSCRDMYGRMIYTGSGAEFDKRFSIIHAFEEDIGKRMPVDQYGIAKYTMNEMAQNSDNIYNLRVFGIFGKYENWKKKFISNNCCKAVWGLPVSVRQNCRFDYLYIRDFCRMVEAFMSLPSPRFHSYNAVRGEAVQLCELAEQIIKLSNLKQEMIVCKDGEANEYTASADRIMNELPDFTFTPVSEAIGELLQYYKQNKSLIEIQSLLYGD